MKNPRNSMDGKDESRRQPGYYQGYNWYDTNDTSPQNDSRRVHLYSRVQNRWYLPHCDGSFARNGSFVEGRQPYSITRIGMEHALQIAYRTLMQYATSQAQYADIRLCHLQSAKDHYGDNSPQVEASPTRGTLSESPPAMPRVLIQLDKRTASPSTPLQRARGVGTRSMAACLKASPQRKVCIFIMGKKS